MTALDVRQRHSYCTPARPHSGLTYPAQLAALMQTVPDLDNTEIILKSTACGYNDFQKLSAEAKLVAGKSLPVFLPWSIDPDYRKPVGDSFVPDADERQLMELHKLLPEQIAWRRSKISQLGSSDYFAQEYPINSAEAFVSSTFDSFIPAALVIKARQEKVEPYGPLIIGVDPAGVGADRTAIAWRRGHRIEKIETRRNLDTMEIVAWLGKIITDEKPAKVNIDVGGMGVGIFDRIMELGHSRSVVQAVNFGGKSHEMPPLDERGNPAGGFANRRAELWGNLKKALEQGRFQLPDRDSLQADLVSCGYRYRSDGKLVLESKEDMRARGVPSPDEGDAVALCFSEPAGSAFPNSKNFRRDLRAQYNGYFI